MERLKRVGDAVAARDGRAGPGTQQREVGEVFAVDRRRFQRCWREKLEIKEVEYCLQYAGGVLQHPG